MEYGSLDIQQMITAIERIKEKLGSLNAKNAIKTQTLLTGQDSDLYWTSAWQSYMANPNEMTLSIVKTRVRSLLLTIVEFAEYQLM